MREGLCACSGISRFAGARPNGRPGAYCRLPAGDHAGSHAGTHRGTDADAHAYLIAHTYAYADAHTYAYADAHAYAGPPEPADDRFGRGGTAPAPSGRYA